MKTKTRSVSLTTIVPKLQETKKKQTNEEEK